MRSNTTQACKIVVQAARQPEVNSQLLLLQRQPALQLQQQNEATSSCNTQNNGTNQPDSALATQYCLSVGNCAQHQTQHSSTVKPSQLAPVSCDCKRNKAQPTTPRYQSTLQH